jgi:hypothetical protein
MQRLRLTGNDRQRAKVPARLGPGLRFPRRPTQTLVAARAGSSATFRGAEQAAHRLQQRLDELGTLSLRSLHGLCVRGP